MSQPLLSLPTALLRECADVTCDRCRQIPATATAGERDRAARQSMPRGVLLTPHVGAFSFISTTAASGGQSSHA
jgi:hypothetical protein